MKNSTSFLQRLILVVFLGVFVWVSSNAQSGSTFRQWGEETMAQIESDFRMPNSNLYSENLEGWVAFAWPQGIALDALIANNNITQAEAHANEVHNRYWCYTNNIWGYNATADNCGDRYYDDNAWLAIALMELYEKTSNSTYLNRAREVVAFSMSGENPAGGISWHEGAELHYSICSTAPTAVANLMIYQATNIDQYRVDGSRLYDWMKSQGWGIGPGYRGYENAVQCQAAILLHQITGNTTYRDDAQHLGLAMETFYINWETHALHETGQWGGHDMTNAYVDLFHMDGDIKWLNIAAGYLKYLHDNCKDANGRYPEAWNDQSGGNPYLLYQAPVARAFLTMGTTAGGVTKDHDPVAVFQDCSYIGWSAGFGLGSYTLADMNFHGVRDNDISSVKVQPGFKVTFYENDNFQGASLVKTADQTCLVGDGWNDMATSFVVEVESPTAIVYKDCNYGGYAVHLAEGNYTLSQLQAKGIFDNDISGVVIGSGYQVQLFENDNFSGASVILTSDNSCLVNNGWNDRATSVRVSTIGSGDGNGDGLIGYYYNGMNFDNPVQTRIDSNIDFNWGLNSPLAGVNADVFTVRWRGQIQPRYSQNYTFHITSDNGRRVWINDQLIIDKWVDDWDVTYTGNITLTAGQKYDIKVEYFENNGGANCKLEWSSASQVREIVPQSQLYSEILAGDGLTGEYYNGNSFENFVLSRTDAAIDFDWGLGSPASGINVDYYSVRWTGLVVPRYSENYTFYITSDNGRRVWINGQLIIDQWVDDWGIEYTGTINLKAGFKYDIKVEYFENWGGANCKLEWSSPSQQKEIVPQSQLYSSSTMKSAQLAEPVLPIEPSSLVLYPNPVNDYLNVEMAGASALRYVIMSTSGKQVLTDVIQGDAGEINMSSLEAGIYYIRINDTAIQKIIKQ
jgi:hypothetical protein